MWEMLANAGVKRCYGIVGDALNPVIDALSQMAPLGQIRAPGSKVCRRVAA